VYTRNDGEGDSRDDGATDADGPTPPDASAEGTADPDGRMEALLPGDRDAAADGDAVMPGLGEQAAKTPSATIAMKATARPRGLACMTGSVTGRRRKR
jgi:hypothetical protein